MCSFFSAPTSQHQTDNHLVFHLCLFRPGPPLSCTHPHPLLERYAPASLSLEPANYGFKVTRKYEGVDDASHVTRDDDGVWHFKLGEKVRVTIGMTTTSRRYHVALIDKLPAGLEPLVRWLIWLEEGE